MKLYENYVNYSVFDGEITLDSSAREHLLATVFLNNPTNKDITLLINGIAYNARLMNVASSKSVQVSYGSDVQAVFKKTFSYSDDCWTTVRQQAKAIGQSTRGLPIQTVESISLLETDTPLVYKVECSTHFILITHMTEIIWSQKRVSPFPKERKPMPGMYDMNAIKESSGWQRIASRLPTVSCSVKCAVSPSIHMGSVEKIISRLITMSQYQPWVTKEQAVLMISKWFVRTVTESYTANAHGLKLMS